MSSFSIFSPPIAPEGPFDKLSDAQLLRVVKKWAHEHGYKGRLGGCIYARDGALVCQGWRRFYDKKRRTIIEAHARGEIKLPKARKP